MWGRTVGIILVMLHLVFIDSNGQSLTRVLEAAEKSLASKIILMHILNIEKH